MSVNNTAYYAAAYQTAAAYQVNHTSLNVSGSYLEITGGVNGSYYGNIEDGVDVSEKARELLERIKELDVFKIIYPDSDPRQKTKTLKEVEGDFMADFNDFAGTFGKMQSMLGFDASSSFTMGLDGTGGMTVAGSDAAMASKVQGAFNGNSVMVSRFAVMAARASLADAGYTVDGFKDAYAEDPVAAIKDNIDALKERLLGFRTVASGGNMQYGFVRDFNLNIDYSSVTASYGAAAAGASEAEVA